MLNVTDKAKILVLLVLSGLLLLALISTGIGLWAANQQLTKLEKTNIELVKENAVLTSANARWLADSTLLEKELQECKAQWEKTKFTFEQMAKDSQKLLDQYRKEVLSWKSKWDTRPLMCETALADLDVKCPHLQDY